jgi:hypothetical protein
MFGCKIVGHNAVDVGFRNPERKNSKYGSSKSANEIDLAKISIKFAAFYLLLRFTSRQRG